MDIPIFVNVLNTEETVKDFEVLRKKLVQKKLLFLVEATEHMQLCPIIRLFGGNVNKAILSLIEGPNHTFKLPLQFDQSIERIDERRIALVGLPALAPLYVGNLQSIFKKGNAGCFSRQVWRT